MYFILNLVVGAISASMQEATEDADKAQGDDNKAIDKLQESYFVPDMLRKI